MGRFAVSECFWFSLVFAIALLHLQLRLRNGDIAEGAVDVT